jgi:hypothetical protein
MVQRAVEHAVKTEGKGLGEVHICRLAHRYSVLGGVLTVHDGWIVLISPLVLALVPCS